MRIAYNIRSMLYFEVQCLIAQPLTYTHPVLLARQLSIPINSLTHRAPHFTKGRPRPALTVSIRPVLVHHIHPKFRHKRDQEGLYMARIFVCKQLEVRAG